MVPVVVIHRIVVASALDAVVLELRGWCIAEALPDPEYTPVSSDRAFGPMAPPRRAIGPPVAPLSSGFQELPSSPLGEFAPAPGPALPCTGVAVKLTTW